MSELGRERAATPVGTLRRISWGGIVAGAILALMIQFMLGLFGLGVGLSTATGAPGGILSVAGIWAVVVVLVGVFAGGFAAARFAGIPSAVDGALHGIVTWAVTALLALYLLTSGAAGLVGGAFGVLGQSVDDMARAAEALGPASASLGASLKANSAQLFAPAEAGADGAASGEAAAPEGAATPQDRDAAYSEVLDAAAAKGDGEARNTAISAIARTAGVGRAEAERRFDAFAERYGKAQAAGEADRQAAASRLARASFSAFVAMLLGMAVGAAGGVIGRPGRGAGEGRSARH
ncbi:hypothetical protein [Jiella sonneratiae]|uniref:PhnA-like protein n=1 Tax=Jiella sonneratiae TaxID=2816856 RepID=A0ABS3J488_9HYPH|nr:hypothetical protein [Jiella sonneratiae]MBO0904486.1 hypothetical protein [Jiella sonneratiae]